MARNQNPRPEIAEIRFFEVGPALSMVQPGLFVEQVNQLLKEGWQLYGDPVPSQNSNRLLVTVVRVKKALRPSVKKLTARRPSTNQEQN